MWWSAAASEIGSEWVGPYYMRNQRSALGLTSSHALRKTAQSPCDQLLIGHKARKESPKTSPVHKSRPTVVSPKLSSTLSRVKSGEIPKPKPEYTRGKALEVLLEEDLKSAKKMGLNSEVAAIRRVFQAVMDRSQEFKGVLEAIQSRYEELISRQSSEMTIIQTEIAKQQEEKKLLMKRLDSLIYENALMKRPKEASPPPRPALHSPKAQPENTERMAAWGAKHARKDSVSSLSSIEIEPLVKGPPKPFKKPQFVPRLHLELLQKHQVGSPKASREAIYIEEL